MYWYRVQIERDYETNDKEDVGNENRHTDNNLNSKAKRK
jgi:hypothetical protein